MQMVQDAIKPERLEEFKKMMQEEQARSFISEDDKVAEVRETIRKKTEARALQEDLNRHARRKEMARARAR